MIKKILITALLATALNAWDSEIPTECEGLFETAMDSKGTTRQEKTFNDFIECAEDVALIKKQPLCYSLTGAFIGKEDYSCTLPSYAGGR